MSKNETHTPEVDMFNCATCGTTTDATYCADRDITTCDVCHSWEFCCPPTAEVTRATSTRWDSVPRITYYSLFEAILTDILSTTDTLALAHMAADVWVADVDDMQRDRLRSAWAEQWQTLEP